MKNKYTTTNIILIIILFSVAYIYCLVYAPSIENINDDSFTSLISSMNKSCLLNCNSDNCKKYIRNIRGDKYFISIPKDEQIHIKNCLITFWGFSHFLLYLFATLILPDFYIEFFFVGIGFELYEYYRFDCHDANDIVLNTLGIIIGKYLSPF